MLKPKPNKNAHFSFAIASAEPPPRPSKEELEEKDRLIKKWLKTNKIKKIPPRFIP